MLDSISLSPPLFLLSISILGLIIGSFLNVVIVRLPTMLQKDWYDQCKTFLAENYDISITHPKEDLTKPYNLLFPASTCPSCDKPIKWYDNIPILSFCLLKGRCRHCSHNISWRYPIIEFATACLSVMTAIHFGMSFALIPALLLTWALITLTVIDFDLQILPDNITLPFLWLGLLINLQGVFCPLTEAILGASVGYLTLWSFYWLFKLITGKEGMGYGDFKLLGMLGAWIGIKSILPIILISTFIGAFVGITLIVLRKHKRGAPIPFGPFLAGAGWIVFLYGDKILNYYFVVSGLTV